MRTVKTPHMPPASQPLTDPSDQTAATAPGPAKGPKPGKPAREPMPRYHALPASRILANMDIVYVHMLGAYLLLFGENAPGLLKIPWGAGLPLFLILSIALTARRAEPMPILMHAKRRAQRLILPWVFWTAFFGIFSSKYYWGLYHDPNPITWIIGWPRLEHLWFLPFIFTADVIANLLCHALRRVNAWTVIVTGLLVGYGYIAYVMPQDLYEHGHKSLHHWSFGAAAIPFGLVLGRTLAMSKSAKARYPMWALTGFCLGMLLFFKHAPLDLLHLDERDLWNYRRFSMGMLMLSLTMTFPLKNLAPLTFVGSLTMGVYILHAAAIKRVDGIMHLVQFVPGWQDAWSQIDGVRFTLVWVTTAGIVAVLRLTPLRRFL